MRPTDYDQGAKDAATTIACLLFVGTYAVAFAAIFVTAVLCCIWQP